jgi:hypothetical protein
MPTRSIRSLNQSVALRRGIVGKIAISRIPIPLRKSSRHTENMHAAIFGRAAAACKVTQSTLSAEYRQVIAPDQREDHNHPNAKTGILTTKWSPHAQWALAREFLSGEQEGK